MNKGYGYVYVSLKNCKKLKKYFVCLAEVDGTIEHDDIISMLNEQLEMKCGDYAAKIFPSFRTTDKEMLSINSALRLLIEGVLDLIII